MFGYVTVNKLELKIKDFLKYRGYYCGLCKTLKEQYGRFGQMTLTYDMTFLIIVLTSLYENKTVEDEERCLVHPMKKHLMLTNEISKYGADMNIALTYHHFLDDWQDDRSYKGLAGANYLKREYKRIEAKYPRQCKVIVETLARLTELEQKNETDIDLVAGCFGELMGELFVYQQDVWEEQLRKMGFFLGKFIYLIDAYEDLDEDIKTESYNVLRTLHEEKDYESRCEQILTMMMSECSNAFETLPLVEDIEILRNIIYLGVWNKYDQLRKEKVMVTEGKEQSE